MLPIAPPFLPMEAATVRELPGGSDWQFEPKWDGFRCIAFRDGGDVRLQSKAGQPLERYLLVDERGSKVYERPLADRRQRLERFAARYFVEGGRVRLSPATLRRESATRWLTSPAAGLDGVIAKRVDLPYRTGERTGMVKVKRLRTADCVVGGFRYASKGGVVGSLLLGLYDEDGLLHHVGFTSSLTAGQRKDLTPRLEKLVRPPGFTGRAPGGPSRWSTKRSSEWQPLRPKLVAEVQYDHFTGGRFRHGTKFLRWRPDKAPAQCTLDQVRQSARSAMAMLD